MIVGVLALQGAFKEHRYMLERLGVSAKEVRLPEDLSGCNGLILPGGETTVQRRLSLTYGLWQPVRNLAAQGLPILGTCAGLILMAKTVDTQKGCSMELMDIDIQRNAYGRQIFSFEVAIHVPVLNDRFPGGPFNAIFIRAPRITRVGDDAHVLAYHNDEPVAVQQGNLLAVSFHPELTGDDRFHAYFLELVTAFGQA